MKMSKIAIHLTVLTAFLICVGGGFVLAQVAAEQQDAAVLLSDEAAPTASTSGFNEDDYNSLVFNQWEHESIELARNRRGSVREVTDAELARSLKNTDRGEKKKKPPADQRDISLGGIVFRDNADWTIWLNSKRVTPEALPVEVLELRVYDKYIEMEWYDEYTEQIFPIRLRPHQRFNIDTRMFLPG